jgi:hypothetical protein
LLINQLPIFRRQQLAFARQQCFFPHILRLSETALGWHHSMSYLWFLVLVFLLNRDRNHKGLSIIAAEHS